MNEIEVQFLDPIRLQPHPQYDGGECGHGQIITRLRYHSNGKQEVIDASCSYCGKELKTAKKALQERYDLPEAFGKPFSILKPNE